jgi:RNA recognition motif. (a.k.a. RRM, RBD, or RNP domain)
MFRRLTQLLSNPTNGNQRKKIPGFYKPFRGASYMKRAPIIKHDPEVAAQLTIITPPDKLKGPELLRVYGNRVVKLLNLPTMRTPEYLQDRLMKYFTKFGNVVQVRVFPHKLDPYQSSGVGVVVFEQKKSCLDALKEPLLFPYPLGGKVVRMMFVAEGKWNDQGLANRLTKRAQELTDIAKDIYQKISSSPDPQKFHNLVIPHRQKIRLLFENYEEFFETTEMKELFRFDPSTGFLMIAPNPNPETAFVRLKNALAQLAIRRLSVDWRKGKLQMLDMPLQTKKKIELIDHKDPLPESLQVLSRDFKRMRVFDEKNIVKQKQRDEKRPGLKQARSARRQAKKQKILEFHAKRTQAIDRLD